MPDRGKGGFNWVAGPDTLPMLCRKVEECHEFGPILLQAQRRLGVFGVVGFDEQIKGLVRIVLGLGLPPPLGTLLRNALPGNGYCVWQL